MRMMSRRKTTISTCTLAAFACALLASTSALQTADVSYERLLNPESQNWLTHHRDYGAQRHSPLEVINRSNIRSLKLAFAAPLGGKSAGESLEATPLVVCHMSDKRLIRDLQCRV